MKVSLELSKSIEENANKYYDKSKKAKKKLEGLKKAIIKTKEKLSRLESKQEIIKEKVVEKKEARKKAWYEKFRWFISSEGFLCIGGRDATTNDIIIKKHADKGDLVFHTQIKGSPFFIIKSEGKKIGKSSIQEAAQACASFSRAWQQGTTTTEVYYITPEQVKHELGLPKGTFMIYGKRTYITPILELAIGVTDKGEVMCAPRSAVEKNCKVVITVKQGDYKKSDIAKKLKSYFLKDSGISVDTDDIISVLPPGNSQIIMK